MEIKVAKSGKSASSSDPNDFIFHSDYNTFKIIKTGIVEQVVKFTSTTIEVAHELDYTPLVYAFMKADTNDEAISARFMFLVTGDYQYVGLDTVSADSSKIYFFVRQYNNYNVTIKIKYYIFEVPL